MAAQRSSGTVPTDPRFRAGTDACSAATLDDDLMPRGCGRPVQVVLRFRGVFRHTAADTWTTRDGGNRTNAFVPSFGRLSNRSVPP